MDLVSIVIPVYNMGNKIIDCTKSILNQTYTDLEIILVDDGSIDDSLKQCKKLQECDKRIRVIHTENRGSGPARNEGIYNANGRYIYFPDADDYLEPNAIETLVEKMQKAKCDLVVFGYRNIGIKGNLISTKKYQYNVYETKNIRKNYYEFLSLSGKNTIQGAPWNKFFDLNVIKKYQLEYPALRRHQDEGFIARYVNVAKRVCFITDVLYVYYVNDLNRQWDKYPVDYIDAVEGLFEERKTNILIWNAKDRKTHDLIYQEYICGIIKAFELSFSPKFNFTSKERVKWLKENIKIRKFDELMIPKCLGKYQKIVMRNIQRQKIKKVYCILKIKVFFEKNNLLKVFKKYFY